MKDLETEYWLHHQISEFKARAWRQALEQLKFYLDLLSIRIVERSGPESVWIELFKQARPYFSLEFRFEVSRPGDDGRSPHVRPRVAFHMQNMEMISLEKRFPALDRELALIESRDIYDVVESLVRFYREA
ncbi:MAG: hypothetical protein ABFD52_01820 [Acidobacteriota bacterium]